MARPSSVTTKIRTREFLRALSETSSLRAAAVQSQTDPARVLRLLDEDQAFRTAAFALVTEAEAA